MNLKEAIEGKEYIISGIETDDEELDAFLFSLGCYSGECITVVRHLKGGCTLLADVTLDKIEEMYRFKR